MRHILLVALAGMILAAVPVAADVWFIKPDGTGSGGPTIQAGVDSASSGDIVLLANGTFTGDGNRDVDLPGKAITVISISEDPDKCIIDCQGSEAEPHRAMSFYGAVVEGIKITNGWMGEGGAIDMGGGTLRNCVLENNHASFNGGAIRMGNGTVEDCVFLGNTADSHGGAMIISNWGLATVSRCLFIENYAYRNASAICIWYRFTVVHIDYCTFVANSTFWPNQATIGMDDWYPTGIDHFVVTNCTFAYNDGGIDGMSEEDIDLIENTIIAYQTDGYPINDLARLSCCNLYGNAEGDWVRYIASQYGLRGNISEEPFFCNPVGWDFTLADCSPCAPENSPEGCGLIGAHVVGCTFSGIDPDHRGATTWGGIKALYR